MLNMIRMELYRMVRMKSFWVIMIIVGFMNVITVAMNDAIMDNEEIQQAIAAAEGSKDSPAANIGMNVSVKRNSDGSYDFLELIGAAARGMLCALFVGIFTVLYATADFSTGYIKNYGGGVKHRYHMVFSKATGVLAYTLLFFAVFIGSSCLGAVVAGRRLVFASAAKTIEIIGMQLLLHMTFGLVIMALCLVVRNNLISMIISVCISANVFLVLYSLIDKGLKKLGWKKAAIENYTVSGRILKYGADDAKMLGSTLVVIAAFTVASFLIGSVCMSKKDLA